MKTNKTKTTPPDSSKTRNESKSESPKTENRNLSPEEPEDTEELLNNLAGADSSLEKPPGENS